MRAILIDAVRKQVREIEISGDLKSLQDCVEGYIELVRLDDKNDMYVNEEGLINGTQDFFTYHGAHQPFAGSAVIVGHNDEGETTPTTLALKEVRDSVKFLPLIDALKSLGE